MKSTHRVGVTSKITPSTIVMKNNYIKLKSNLSNQIKFLLFFKLFFGFNRVYLLPVKKCTLLLSYVFSVLYTVILIIYSCYSLPNQNFISKSYKYAFTGAHIIYTIFSLRKKNLLKYFRSMKMIDDQLSVNNLNISSSVRKVVILTLTVVISNCIEHFLLFSIYFCLKSQRGGILASMIYSIVSNLELVFYSMLLWFIFTRVSVVKTQIEDLYSISKISLNKKESTARSSLYTSHQRVNILHRVYVKLHDCSLLLSSVFGIPVSSFTL